MGASRGEKEERDKWRDGLFIFFHKAALNNVMMKKKIIRNNLKIATNSHTDTNHRKIKGLICVCVQCVGVSVTHLELNDPLSIPAKERQRLLMLL